MGFTYGAQGNAPQQTKANMSKTEKLAEITAKQAETNLSIFAMLADHGITIVNGQLIEAIENDEE